MNLTYSLRQSAQVNSTPYIDLRSISFSVESWIKPSIVGDGNEHVIFGQCSVLNVDQCMRTSIGGSGVLILAFRSDSQYGSRIIPTNSWSHVASVYNLTAQTVSLYVNGTLDTSNSGHGPFAGVPYPLEIGDVALYDSSVNISFGGCIDEIWFYPFARTTAEIAATFALG